MFRYTCSFVVFVFAALATGIVYVPEPVSEDCLKCICYVESNCAIPVPLCRNGGGSLSCGPYQITNAYWTDAKRSGRNLGTDWMTCAGSFTCSAQAVQGYMEVWAQKGCDRPTCMEVARIHNGGPNGCMKLSTLPYWRKVYKCLYDTKSQ